MICSDTGSVDEGVRRVLIGKPDSKGLIDEDSVSHDVPGAGKLLEAVLGDADRSIFSMSPVLRACSRSPLEPEDEGYSGVFLGGSVFVSRVHAIVHSGFAFGVVPVDFFVA